MVVVDTSVWIQAFRPRPSFESEEVDKLLSERRAVMTGPVLTELLQGAHNLKEHQALRIRLMSLPYLEATLETWASAGLLASELAQQGQVIGTIDLVIATLALQHGHEVYSLDHHFQRVPGLTLYIPVHGNG